MNDDDFVAANSTPATWLENSIVAGFWVFVLVVIYFSCAGITDANDFFGAVFGYGGY
jgi:hypothetical protein